jgi:hypothetical protein
MAFGKITKEDLKEAGLDPDKLATFQEKGVTKDDLISLKTELSTSVNDLIKQQFTDLETRLRTPVQRTENDDPNKKNQNIEEEVDAITFMEDPITHVRKEVNKVANQGAIDNKKMLYDFAYERLSSTLKGFKNEELKKEIDADLARYTPQIMVALGTDPKILITSVHDKVIGAHFEDIQRDTARKEGKFSLVHGGGSNRIPDNNGPEKKPEDSLTEQELIMAKKFDMTPAEYAASKESTNVA